MKAIVEVFQTRRSRKYVKKEKEKKNGLKAPTQKKHLSDHCVQY